MSNEYTSLIKVEPLEDCDLFNIPATIERMDHFLSKQNDIMNGQNYPHRFNPGVAVCSTFNLRKFYKTFVIKQLSEKDVSHPFIKAWFVRNHDEAHLVNILDVISLKFCADTMNENDFIRMDTSDLSFPVGGKVQWEIDRGIPGLFWGNPMRWKYLKFVRDELEFIYQNNAIKI